MFEVVIDVRNAWPLYINGNLAIELRGCPRDITIKEAEKWIVDQREVV